MSTERAGEVIDATSREFASGQKVFGRYTLIKVLGRGGMGIVWLARDEELERDVALKFLPDLVIHDRSAFDQLRRETKRCLELTHPHIVRIHDFVHDERSGGISMEYIDGETLSNLRAEKEQKVFEPDEIATWISQLCDALDYAHTRAKVIHCDLKPANLMVNQRSDLKVTDFGIARNLSDSVSRLTLEQGRSGTLIYMSPQQTGHLRARRRRFFARCLPGCGRRQVAWRSRKGFQAHFCNAAWKCARSPSSRQSWTGASESRPGFLGQSRHWPFPHSGFRTAKRQWIFPELPLPVVLVWPVS